MQRMRYKENINPTIFFINRYNIGKESLGVLWSRFERWGFFLDWD